MQTPIRSLRALALATLLLGAAAAPAHDYEAGTLKVDRPWARPTVGGQAVGGGYLTIVNRGPQADRLLGARSPRAERVEMHTMSMDGDVMRMRELAAIELPAGASVELKPGGLHLMLVGLKQPLKGGEQVPLTLSFERAGELRVELTVGHSPVAAPARHKH